MKRLYVLGGGGVVGAWAFLGFSFLDSAYKRVMWDADVCIHSINKVYEYEPKYFMRTFVINKFKKCATIPSPHPNITTYTTYRFNFV